MEQIFHPYKNLKGLLKYIENMEKDEFIDFQKSLLEKMQSELFKSYNFEKPRDFDQEYYQKIEGMLLLLKGMGVEKLEIKYKIDKEIMDIDIIDLNKMVARS
jgi:hypothetical protein